MNLRARPARPHITHFPEIIFFIPVQDSIFRQIQLPILQRLFILLQMILLTSLENRCIQPIFIQTHLFRKELPSVSNRLFLEIITERPITQHLEHRVMIGIMSHLLQIIVLPGNTQTFLGIRHPGCLRTHIPQNYIFKLIHPGIGEHQRGVSLDHHGCRWYYCM